MISDTKLDSQNLRVAYTELISLYSHSGQSFFKVQNDIENGVGHFKKAFETFEICNKKGIVDIKMIKNFCESLHSFMSMLPYTEVSKNSQYVKKIIESQQHYIGLIYLNRKVIFKYAEKFEDDSLNWLLDNNFSEGTKIGNIVKAVNESYVFIESENEKYFAHITDFLDIKTTFELNKVKQGQLVSFEEGQNYKGPCAINIKIISS